LIWLLRKDKEASRATLPSLETEQLEIDWPNPALLGRAWLHRLPRIPGLALDVTADALSRVRLQRGLAMISGAHALITDRLHGHVLSTLLGIPNVLLPDAFGKNQGLYETWTYGLPGTAFAHTREEALKKIENMVGG
jgi:pyruvyl transferase EpsO